MMTRYEHAIKLLSVKNYFNYFQVILSNSLQLQRKRNRGRPSRISQLG